MAPGDALAGNGEMAAEKKKLAGAKPRARASFALKVFVGASAFGKITFLLRDNAGARIRQLISTTDKEIRLPFRTWDLRDDDTVGECWARPLKRQVEALAKLVNALH